MRSAVRFYNAFPNLSWISEDNFIAIVNCEEKRMEREKGSGKWKKWMKRKGGRHPRNKYMPAFLIPPYASIFLWECIMCQCFCVRMHLASVVTQPGSAAWSRNVAALSWEMFTVLTTRSTVTTTVPRVLWRVLLTTLDVLPIYHHMTRVDVPQTLSWRQMYVMQPLLSFSGQLDFHT